MNETFVEQIDTINLSNTLGPSDITTRNIKRIAAATLDDSNNGIHAIHATQRRRGTRKLLTHMATMSEDIPISLKADKTGVVFKKSGKQEAVRLFSFEREQDFLTRNQNGTAFVTHRALVEVPIQDFAISLSSWAIGVNQIVAAKGELQTKEIESVIGEHGWVVALMGMLTKGLKMPEIIAKFETFESNEKLQGYKSIIKRKPSRLKWQKADYKLIVPKEGWFKPTNGFIHLQGVADGVPLFKGLQIDYENFNSIWSKIERIYSKLDKRYLPSQTIEELCESSSINVRKAQVKCLLASLQEEAIKKLVRSGQTKEVINQRHDLESLRYRFEPRFMTMYIIDTSASVDFYPLRTYRTVQNPYYDPK